MQKWSDHHDQRSTRAPTLLSLTPEAKLRPLPVPTQNDPATGKPGNADGAMLYVDGNITSWSDPGQGSQPSKTGCADRLLSQQRDSTRYSLQNAAGHADAKPDSRTPAETLIPAIKQAGLGFSPQQGDIQLNNTQSNGNWK